MRTATDVDAEAGSVLAPSARASRTGRTKEDQIVKSVNRSRRGRLVLVVTCGAILAGCVRYEARGTPMAVPEFRPGFLAGYLPPEKLPNSLALLPPPPAAGSVAFALDEEYSRKSVALRDTPAWTLATSDADLMFPHAAGTFSCALNVPITEKDTPHLYAAAPNADGRGPFDLCRQESLRAPSPLHPERGADLHTGRASGAGA